MKILIISSISPDAIDRLKKKHDVICAFTASRDLLKSHICDREILVFRSGVSVDADLLECGPELKLLIRAGSGTDNVDLDYVNSRGLIFRRIPEPGADAVAEISFAFMLALARNILKADELIRQGRWAKYELIGYLLRRKILGIFGAGNIGTRVGQLGVTWGMEVIGCVKHPSADRANQLAQKGIRLVDCNEVVSRADFLSIHVPLNDSTRNLINENTFEVMKPGSYLVNLARGGVVDEQALFRILSQKNRLAGAALDVHLNEGEGEISPLASLTNVILTPHIGAQTIDTQREIGERILDFVSAFETGVENTNQRNRKQIRPNRAATHDCRSVL